MRAAFALLAALCAAPALAQDGTNCIPPIGSHTVEAGNTLSAIATNYSVSLDQIRYVNPDIKDINFLEIGQVVQIPSKDCKAPAFPPTPDPQGNCSTDTEPSYTVVAKDTFTTIAQSKVGVRPDALEAANPQIPNKDLIFPGQILNVPICSDFTPSTCSQSSYDIYTVKDQQTFNGIAKIVGLLPEVFRSVNPQVADPNTIFPGELLHVRRCGSAVTPTPDPGSGTPTCSTGTERTYTVQSGDTFGKIAGILNVTLEALEAENKQIPDYDKISPGQTIYIPLCKPPPSSCPAPPAKRAVPYKA